MIRNAKALSVDKKAAIESPLGRRVLENEAISVVTIDPPAIPMTGVWKCFGVLRRTSLARATK